MATRMNYENTHDKAADDSINRGKVLMYIADMQQGVSGEYSDPVEAEKHEYAYQVLEWVFTGIKEMEPAEMPGPSNTIYRQAAIDLLKRWSDGYSYIEVETNSAIKAFEEMPPALPEIKTDGDTISRQEAIDALNEYLRLSEVSKTVQNMTSIQAILKWLPYAQPEGKWINADAIFHIQVYDDEHEEFTTKEMSLADILDAYTDEGCPDPGAAMR